MDGFLQFLSMLYAIQTRRQKMTFFAVVGLTLMTAYIEYSIVTLVGPLIASIGGPSTIETSNTGVPSFSPIFGLFGGSSVLLAILMIILAVASAVIRISQIYVAQSYTYGIGHQLSVFTLHNALDADYVVLKKSHSSELLARFEKINIAINSVLNPLTQLFSSGTIAVAIFASLFTINPLVSAIGLVVVALFYAAVGLLSRGKLLRNSAVFNQLQGERLFLIREAISGFRELKIGSILPAYREQFEVVDRNMRHAQVLNLVLSASPRFLLETMAIIAVALVILWNSGGDNYAIMGIVSLLATFGIAAQRLLPHAQTIYSNSASIVGYLHMVLELVQPMFPAKQVEKPRGKPQKESLSSEFKSIDFAKVGFVYPNAPAPAISNITLSIAKGERVALVGASGYGKSTFLEIFCGLLSPTSGSMDVDGTPISDANIDDWQRHIAYVPQHPFLTSGSIRENLLIGSMKREIATGEITAMLESVGLADWFSQFPDGPDHPVGENGNNLSGGQRQRLAIARALISGRKILVMDEITSNLDAANEAAILELILALPRSYTLICSLHKAPKLERFDAIINFVKPSTNAHSSAEISLFAHK